MERSSLLLTRRACLGRSRVGIVGTFDVENYGDLLFPLMAEAAFAQRDQSIQVVPFSPNSRSDRSWPFRVYSTADIPEFLPALSAVLIGGGQIVRFDKGYPVPADPHVNLPIAYWLIPAALGALIGKPVFLECDRRVDGFPAGTLVRRSGKHGIVSELLRWRTLHPGSISQRPRPPSTSN